MDTKAELLEYSCYEADKELCLCDTICTQTDCIHHPNNKERR